MASKSNGQGTASLSDTVERKLLAYVEDFVKKESQKSIFAIGGRIPINEETGGAAVEPEQTLKSPPVTIRWDTQTSLESKTDNNLALRADLPLARPNDDKSFKQLIEACHPATFGRGNKDVYDESYRKASKLDTSQFSTNFNPYEFGIIDSVAKVLLPSVLAKSGAKAACSRGVRAELYKLNIYSAPSGKFKAHVDTPRAISQFGSLVVCLPSFHEGGQLVVRHHGEEIVFDWTTPAKSTSSVQQQATSHSLQWAAFYSDCEHEVLEVTKGHRVTLTYNLYVVSRGIPSGISAMDPETLPVTKLFKNMLTNPGFLNKGAILGFHCAHAYAHTNARLLANQTLPSSLKGIDMAIYTALRAAGLEVCLRPAFVESDWVNGLWVRIKAFDSWMNNQKPCDERWDHKAWGDMSYWMDHKGTIVKDPNEKIRVRTDLDEGSMEFVYRQETDEDTGPAARARILNLWQHFCGTKKTAVVGKELLPFKSSEWTVGYDDETIFDIMDDWRPDDRDSISDSGDDDDDNKNNNEDDGDDDDEVNDTRPVTMFEDYCHMTPELEYWYETKGKEQKPYDLVSVQWLNKPVHKEPAIGYMTYGNDASPATLYSKLAIFAKVPPLKERLG